MNHFAGHRCKGLTYEELIFVNPVEDMRLFTRGDAGTYERAFYDAHRVIEQHLMELIELEKEALKARSLEPLKAKRMEIEAHFAAIIARTSKLAEMPPGVFEKFRKYFKSHDTRKLKGPSGAFSARIPIFELLVCGRRYPQAQHLYLAENRIYFPECDDGLLEFALWSSKGDECLLNLMRMSDPTNVEIMKLFVEGFLVGWTAAHRNTASRQLPAAFRGEDVGTSGERDVKKFLTDRLLARHQYRKH